MKEEWLMPGAFVPVDANTTGALVAEIKRLIGVVGGMALNQQRTWVGLTDAERDELADPFYEGYVFKHKSYAKAVEAKLKEKNT